MKLHSSRSTLKRIPEDDAYISYRLLALLELVEIKQIFIDRKERHYYRRI